MLIIPDELNNQVDEISHKMPVEIDPASLLILEKDKEININEATLEEVDLSQTSDLSDELQGSSLSVCSAKSSTNIYPCLSMETENLVAQHQYLPVQIVQAVHPIQTVQPFPNLLVQQQQQRNTKPQIISMQNTQYQQSISNVNLNKQYLIEQQIKQELDLDSSSQSSSPSTSSLSPSLSNEYHTNGPIELDNDTTSFQLDKKAMLTSQSLDNTAIQKLVCEEVKSHIILDDKECLQVKSAQEFVSLFRSNVSASIRQIVANETSISLPQGSGVSCSPTSASLTAPTNDDKLVKCVSIFGNTGDGKSHTLNHTFFNGRNIFRTSQKQETCTMGVWCAYDSITNSLIFDTEGLLGTTTNENKRMRLLLKVLAISDVIIYRTRAERLHNDLFKFLSDASTAYLKYFSKELKQAAVKLKLDTISCLGPDCVIFHETQHTNILCDEFDSDGHERIVSHQLRDRFSKLDLNYSAFSSIEYVGTRTCFNSPNSLLEKQLVSTDFTKLAQTVRYLLRNNSVRPPRKLSSIYQVFKVLNDKFNGVITKNQVSTFADEYFTCSSVCLSCGLVTDSMSMISIFWFIKY